MVSFGLVGFSGFIIDLALYLGLQALGLEHRLARVVSFWPSVTWNWWLNRRITFDERMRPAPARQWGRFVIASLLGLGINVGSYLLLTQYVGVFTREPLLAFLLGIVLGGASNFLMSTAYVYRRHSASDGTVDRWANESARTMPSHQLD